MNAPKKRRPSTRNQITFYSDEICSAKSVEDVAELLHINPFRLQMIGLNPKYRDFYIPKKDGSKRHIESPVPELKAIQRRLNQYLQCVYFEMQTEAAYGFVINARDIAKSKHIITNAEQHIGCQYLFNADIEDFFHQVSQAEVLKIFQAAPFRFSEAACQLLASLSTRDGRLPMGSPTSPVLSNFATREMDEVLLTIATQKAWNYTRYADDMSFSSQLTITESEKKKIQEVVQSFGFTFNKEKFKYYLPDDDKIVTGLLVKSDKVDLPRNFMRNVHQEIERIQHIMETMPLSGKRDTDWIDDYEDRIEGLIQFAALVRGQKNDEVRAAKKSLRKALNPPDDHAALSWMNFPYVPF